MTVNNENENVQSIKVLTGDNVQSVKVLSANSVQPIVVNTGTMKVTNTGDSQSVKVLPSDSTQSVKVSNNDNTQNVQVNSNGTLSTNNYNDLVNLPQLDGVEIKGNVSEQDPTVPTWAKSSCKPTYCPEEIGALNSDDEMKISEVKSIWDTVFN